MTEFDLYLIRPTRYDEEGYPIQWVKTHIPSNSLAVLYGLAIDCTDREILGEGVNINIHAIDEYNTDVNPKNIIKKVKKSGRRTLVAMVGVQTNQFPRTVDLAREFIAADIPVCVGGFHVSGCLSMLKELPADIKEAQEMGISFFAGEAEEQRFDQVLIDAWNGELKPIYDYSNQVPSIENVPLPNLPLEEVKKTFGTYSSFDLGRGCPFDCSFCTIINVQGRKSRFRTADDLEAIIRDNAKEGITRFFLTDDNFARNKNWRVYTDKLIKLREEEGLPIDLIIQVDTMAHRIDGFIESVARAGASKIFIGLESINPDSLEHVNKRQNRIEEYRDMFLAWKKHSVFIICGYILGFPTDTKESIMRDIGIIKRYLPIDNLYMSYLTPLPGSADHKAMYEAGEWMDPDMNRYNLFNRVSRHPVMSDQEWEEAFKEAHDSFYSLDHIATIFKRMVALGSNKKYITLWYSLGMHTMSVEDRVTSVEMGIIRIRRRKQRRPKFSIENPLIFYPKYFWRELKTTVKSVKAFFQIRRIMLKAWTDPKRYDYTDEAICDMSDDQQDVLIDQVRTTERVEKRLARNAANAAKKSAEKKAS